MMASRSFTGSSFPAANNVLQKKWNQRNYEMHVAKKNGMKTKIDATSPKTYPHLQVNMKKLQTEEEKQALIDHDNRILLAKLTNIIRSGGGLDNWNFEYDAAPKSLNTPFKNREQERIEKENAALLKRLNKVKPMYNFDKMEDDYLMHNYYLTQKAQVTKSYEVDLRGVNETSSFIFYAKDRHANKEKTFIEGDIEETIEVPTEEEALELQATKLPRGKRLPTRQQLKRRTTKLPVIGQERKKAEEKKKKEAVVKPQMYNQKDEAAKLFKATKGMGNPEQILVQTLAKRTYQQRQDTLAKFEDTYGLTLEQELKDNLSAEYDDIIESLLATREDLDALTLRRALKGEDSLVEPVIEILCTRSNAAIAGIKESYEAKFGVSLEDDITAEIKGKLRHLSLALAKGCRAEETEVDEDQALKDAEALKDAGSEARWDVSSGKMASLLQEASLVHLREVLVQYDQLTNSELEKELRRSLIGDFQDAMICMVRCLNSCTQFMAERLHSSLTGEADDTTLMRIIITRSELDLPQIRRSYKRLYKQTLVESIEQRCTASFKQALIQMVVVHGAPHKQEQPKDTAQGAGEASTAEVRQTQSPKASQQKPLRRPAPNPNAKVPSNNPLLKSTQQANDARKTPQSGTRPKQITNAPSSQLKPKPSASAKGRGSASSLKKASASSTRSTPPKQSKTTSDVVTKDATATKPKQASAKKDKDVKPPKKDDAENKTESKVLEGEKKVEEEEKVKEEEEKTEKEGKTEKSPSPASSKDDEKTTEEEPTHEKEDESKEEKVEGDETEGAGNKSVSDEEQVKPADGNQDSDTVSAKDDDKDGDEKETEPGDSLETQEPSSESQEPIKS
ncbi:uncharacterized protein [Diadema antillarum]|uniref:uncharacterized protein n=1 Tax=Diadema antillarum TaxID=105358 RepID=UPI003A88E2E6